MESYRNFDNRICHRTLLNVGFMNGVSAEQMNAIRKELNNLHQKQATIFEQTDPVVIRRTDASWQQLITEKKIDTDWVDKQARKVDIDTIAHTNNVR